MIVAGFGFRKSAQVESLQDAYRRAASSVRVTHIATLEPKATASAFTEMSRALRHPVIGVSEADARQMETTTQSAQSQSAHAVGSVAEATALAAAGPNAELVAPRVVSHDGMATCAIARSAMVGDTA